MWLIWYLGMMLLTMSFDAGFCFVHKRRYRPVPSLLTGVVWPITSVAIIVVATRETRGHPPW